jgi:hypothetical protein
MSWTVILEDAIKNALESLDEEFYIKDLGILMQEQFKLLPYLDPYGDTVFNNLQIPDIILDLSILKEKYAEMILIDTVILLAEKSLKTVHSYLTFYED